jgi:hypothetical protein
MFKKFKYRTLAIADDDDPHPVAPRIPIRLKGQGTTFETMGIIDSGATETFLPKGIAEILGLKLKGEESIRFPDGKGKGKSSNVKIIINLIRESVELTVPCIVLENLDEVVLGRAGFFEYFEILFNERKKEVGLKYLGKSE